MISFGTWLFFSLRLRVEHLMARLHFGFLSLPDLRRTTDVFSQKEGDGVGVHSGFEGPYPCSYLI